LFRLIFQTIHFILRRLLMAISATNANSGYISGTAQKSNASQSGGASCCSSNGGKQASCCVGRNPQDCVTICSGGQSQTLSAQKTATYAPLRQSATQTSRTASTTTTLRGNSTSQVTNTNNYGRTSTQVTGNYGRTSTQGTGSYGRTSAQVYSSSLSWVR
jgi:hypothetical protein